MNAKSKSGVAVLTETPEVYGTSVRFRLTGIVALLQHNDRLANPLDEFTKKIKELTSLKAKEKTEAHIHQIAHLEFLGGMHYDPVLGPFVPIGYITRMFEKISYKLTNKSYKGLITIPVPGEGIPIQYKGPRDPEKMWKRRTEFAYTCMVGINGKSKVLRTRPMFASGWQLEFTICFNLQDINQKDLIRFIKMGGIYQGIGDYRPRYGRYDMEVIDDPNDESKDESNDESND